MGLGILSQFFGGNGNSGGGMLSQAQPQREPQSILGRLGIDLSDPGSQVGLAFLNNVISTPDASPFQGVAEAAQRGQEMQQRKVQLSQIVQQKKKQDDQDQALKHMLQGDPMALQLYNAGRPDEAVKVYSQNKGLTPPNLTEVSPGATLFDPRTHQSVFTAPDRTTSTLPSGYRWAADGKSQEPIPGGPADPNNALALSPEALDLAATQYLAGDKSAITGFARNANMRAQIANAIAAKANELGMDGNKIAAELSAYGGNVAAQRAAGTRAAQVGMAASEANQMADIALTASQNVPRGAFVPWNAAMNAVATGTSSPEMAKFVTATTSLVNAYARAVSPLGAPTDAMRQHAEQMLNTAQSPQAYAAVIDQMKQEMEAALNAPAEISTRLKSSVTGQGDAGGGFGGGNGSGFGAGGGGKMLPDPFGMRQ